MYLPDLTPGYTRMLQRHLQRLMYAVGAIDGSFGTKTFQAMQHFLDNAYGTPLPPLRPRPLFSQDTGRMFTAYVDMLLDQSRPPEAPWLLWARRQVGLREFKGKKHNPRIVQMFAAIKAPWFTTDETPWCAAFVGAMLEQSGWRSSRSARARSYEGWGTELDKPAVGAVCVLSRGNNPKQGHVGFVAGWTKTTVTLLGGNQGDEVSHAAFRKSRVVGYFWPKDCLLPKENVNMTDVSDTVSDTKTD